MKKALLISFLLMTWSGAVAQLPFGATKDLPYIIETSVQETDYFAASSPLTYYDLGVLSGSYVGINNYDPAKMVVKSIPRAELWAVRESFTTQELALLNRRQWPFTIVYVVNSEGKILDVKVQLFRSSPLNALPPERIAQFEANLKRYVWWQVAIFDLEIKELKITSYPRLRSVNFDQLTPPQPYTPRHQDLIEDDYPTITNSTSRNR